MRLDCARNRLFERAESRLPDWSPNFALAVRDPVNLSFCVKRRILLDIARSRRDNRRSEKGNPVAFSSGQRVQAGLRLEPCGYSYKPWEVLMKSFLAATTLCVCFVGTAAAQNVVPWFDDF